MEFSFIPNFVPIRKKKVIFNFLEVFLGVLE